MKKYLITLKPLEPYLFGGDTTFGEFGDEKNSSYLVHSRKFPQQSAILGMLKKEIMTQAGLLTKKVRGEWVDSKDKQKASQLVGSEKFDIFSTSKQDFGAIKEVSPVFLLQNQSRYIKKADIDSHPYNDGKLENFDAKNDIHDNFILLDTNDTKKSSDIFESVEQIGNSKQDKENSLFKKTSYTLKDDFKFAFYLECAYELSNSIVYLGADRSAFKLEVKEDNSCLDYEDKNGYLTLLSDSYITVDLKENCEFAITSELSYKQLTNSFSGNKRTFSKSEKIYLYEKGSVIINPSQTLIDNLNNKNLQQIGYNKYTQKGSN
jgi:CRISPR-associated protein Cmr3